LIGSVNLAQAFQETPKEHVPMPECERFFKAPED
jgi:hypothetical protein